MRVYTRKSCGQCTATKNLLERKGIKFDLIDVDSSAGQLFLNKHNFRSLPIVVDGDRIWAGFRPDLIMETKK